MKKAVFVSIACLLVVAAVAIVIVRGRAARAAQAKDKNSQSRPTPVTIATVDVSDVPVTVEGLGTVVPLYTVNVRTLVDGRLESVAYEEGQMVHKGDLLALVDPRPFEISQQQATAQRAKDVATRDNAAITLNRDAELARQGLQSQQIVDNDRATLNSANAAVSQDDAQINAAALNVHYAHITSPIDGVAGIRLVDPGNVVHAADTTATLVVLTQLDPITVIFTLPEDVLPRVMEARAKGALQVSAFSRDGSVQLGQGNLTVVDNQINVQTATARLRAQMSNPANKLWPNQFVKAQLLLETKKGVLVIPASALQHGPNGTFVYVVDDKDDATTRDIVADEIEGDRAIVTSGLQKGERVVTDGQAQLKPGAKVSIQTNAPKGGGKKGQPSP